MQWFAGQANGGDIVIIAEDDDPQRAALRAQYLADFYYAQGTVNSVSVFDFLDDATTDASAGTKEGYLDPTAVAVAQDQNGAALGHEFIDMLKGAEGVYFQGGDQYPYVQLLQTDRNAAQIISAGNNAGNVTVGGTSAGLAVLGNYVFTAQDIRGPDESLLSQDVVSNYYTPEFYDASNGPTIADNVLGLDALDGVVTETHFTDPGQEPRWGVQYTGPDCFTHFSYRLGRFLSFLGATLVQGPGGCFGLPFVRGLAVDQNSALVVTSSGMATVYGTPGTGSHVYFAQADATSPGGEQVSVTAGQQAGQGTLDLPGAYLRWYGVGQRFQLSSGWSTDWTGDNWAEFALGGGELFYVSGANAPFPILV